MHFDSVCPWLCLASTQCSTFHSCNPPVLVIFLTEWLTLHCRLSWMTQTSGRSIRSLIARWISVARGQVSSTWSSGRALTTPQMQPARSHSNTLHMHPTWFKLSIGRTQTSLPSKSLGSGNRYFLTHTDHTLRLFMCFEHIFKVLLFYFISQVVMLSYKSRSSSRTLAISRMASSTFTFQAATPHITPCCCSSAVTAMPINPSTWSRTSRSWHSRLGKGVVGGGIGEGRVGGRVGGSEGIGGASTVTSAAFHFSSVSVPNTGKGRSVPRRKNGRPMHQTRREPPTLLGLESPQ